MSIISYAQNFEDVMLWRALKHIKNGHYIDAGAWSPDMDSVTKLFYEHGWHGINIEPNPKFHSQLMKKRPNDINLCVAVSNKTGSLEMNFINNPGLSTLDDDIAQKHRDNGWEITKHLVEVTTLSEIWRMYIVADQDTHFLKIDVEGLEKEVVRGNDWTKNRPWIAVVEATIPMSQEESHFGWENILLSADYLFAYADGLNRYYVSKEHQELLAAFTYPPNYFDDFLPFVQIQAEESARLSNARVSQAEANAQQAETNAQKAFKFAQQTEADYRLAIARADEKAKEANVRATLIEERLKQIETLLQEAYTSKSWRITAPLRSTAHFIRILKHKLSGDRS
jgi:FkbM family methyltransferase